MKAPSSSSLTFSLGLLLATLASAALHAQTSTGSISFQGALNGANGQPLTNGLYNLTFRFHTNAATGMALATNTVSGVSVSNGIASTAITVSNAWFDGQDRWLGLSINGAAELTPRILITAVPYAIYSGSVAANGLAAGTYGSAVTFNNAANSFTGDGAGLSGLNASSLTAGIIPDSRLSGNVPLMTSGNLGLNGRVGIGTGYSPAIRLDIQGDGNDASVLDLIKNGSPASGDNFVFRVFRDGPKTDIVNNRIQAIDRSGNVTFGGPGSFFSRKQTRFDASGNYEGQPYEASVEIAGTGLPSALDLIRGDGGASSILRVYRDAPKSNSSLVMEVRRDNQVILGTDQNNVNMVVKGTGQVKILQITGGADLAEHLNVADGNPEDKFQVVPGMVVSIDTSGSRKFKLADEPYDKKRVGIISGGNGVSPGLVLRDQGNPTADGEHPIALTGQVWCYADATFGAIQPGDLLTTSLTPGHAMKVTDYAQARFAVLGQALTPLARGRGWVQVLVGKQ